MNDDFNNGYASIWRGTEPVPFPWWLRIVLWFRPTTLIGIDRTFVRGKAVEIHGKWFRGKAYITSVKEVIE